MNADQNEFRFGITLVAKKSGGSHRRGDPSTERTEQGF